MEFEHEVFDLMPPDNETLNDPTQSEQIVISCSG